MNELIKVNNDGNKVTVLGRDLHKFLESKEQYTDWMKRMIGYGFIENIDYYAISEKPEIGIGKGLANHQLTLDMAKHIAMIKVS